MQNGDKAYGWAAPEMVFGLAENTLLDVQLASVKNGTLGVQIEWIGADENFIKASNLLQHSSSNSLLNVRLIDFRPPEKRPYKFRLKVWVEGKDSEIVLSRLLVHASRAWKHPGTNLIQTYKPDSTFSSEEGVAVDVDEDSLGMKLDGNVSQAGIIFSDKVVYHPKGTCMLELLDVEGGVSVDAMCYDGKGMFLKSVEVIHEAGEPGLYESSFNILEERVPAGTALVAWRVQPVGKGASARVLGLYYGVVP